MTRAITPQEAAEARVVQLEMNPSTGELFALTSDGRIFRMYRDPRHINMGPNGGVKHLWALVAGPLDIPA